MTVASRQGLPPDNEENCVGKTNLQVRRDLTSFYFGGDRYGVSWAK